MKHSDFERLMDSTIEMMKELSEKKGGEYAGDTDRLANFKRNAEALELLPEQIWAVYAAKHWDAIMQYIKDSGKNFTRVRMEPIEGRLDDLIVYCVLMKGILWEKTQIKNGLDCFESTPPLKDSVATFRDVTDNYKGCPLSTYELLDSNPTLRIFRT